ncbi:hypothetical protein DAH66_22265 [Sphingomonas koreensis]|uniref:Uncharacterized protein n=1 Tax=Sphingomonas koreensis TaxID=93064 RepID=A0A430FX45_9SPHN|nr:hypothetical protein [Sphingomonas koreensis]RSY76255.1 hypothetical protein DAH66_22265 [Sphingomonas koreensis]
MSTNNTYFTLLDLKASPVTEGTAFLVQDANVSDGTFFWTPGNFTGRSDDENIIGADSMALNVGAWVRQTAGSISFQQSGTGAVIRTVQDALEGQFVSVLDFYQVVDGNNFLPALARSLAASSRVFFPERSQGYIFEPGSPITLTEDTIINFNGQRIISSSAGIAIDLRSTESQTARTLTKNSVHGDPTIEISSAISIQVGDIISIQSNVVPVPLHADRKRETRRVLAKVGSVLTLDDSLNFSWDMTEPAVAAYVYTPVRLTTQGFNYSCPQIDGTTDAYVGLRISGCIDVVHENPQATGVLPFTRTINGSYENIYRWGIQHYYCIGVRIVNPSYIAMSYGTGAYGGTRSVREYNVRSSYCRHSGCDMGEFADGYWLEGIDDDSSGRALSSHACFNWNANKINVRSNLLLSAVRAIGATISDGKVFTAATNADVPHNDAGAPIAGYEYLYSAADYRYENLELVNPARTIFDIHQRYGRRAFFANVRSIDAAIDSSISVRFVDCAFNTAQRATPPVNLIATPSARTAQAPLLDAVLNTGVYEINPRSVMVDQSQGLVRCYGLMARDVAMNPFPCRIRVHTNCFPGVSQPVYVLGRIKLVALVQHENAGFFATQEKWWNFGFNCSTGAGSVFPTEAIFETQVNNAISQSLGSVTWADTGTGLDQHVEFVSTIASDKANPHYSLHYELELVNMGQPGI